MTRLPRVGEAMYQWVLRHGISPEELVNELSGRGKALAACEARRWGTPIDFGEGSPGPRYLLQEFGVIERRLELLYQSALAAWERAGAEKYACKRERLLVLAARVLREMRTASVMLAEMRADWEREDRQKMEGKKMADRRRLTENGGQKNEQTTR
jgi:hypothetical protein